MNELGALLRDGPEERGLAPVGAALGSTPSRFCTCLYLVGSVWNTIYSTVVPIHDGFPKMAVGRVCGFINSRDRYTERQ